MSLSTESDNVSRVRLVEIGKKDVDAKDYLRSYEARDDVAGTVLGRCDLYKQSLFTKLIITDHQDNPWQLRPNRRILTTRWFFKAPDGADVFEVRLPGLLLMLNPFTRTYLHLKDTRAGRSYRLIDLGSNLGDRFFRSPVREWSITERGRVVAKITRLSRGMEQPVKKSFFAGLKRFFTGSDRGLLTPGTEPLFAAPVFIGLMLIYDEVSNAPV